jgi:predicted negative regulator of RcsB-dependent stress response
LDTKFPIAFQPLVDDRLGDVALLENKPDQAKTYFLTAWKAMDVQSDYRQILDMKLAALGVDPKLESASK